MKFDGKRLEHIAIAVRDLDVAQKIFEDFGLSFDDKREVVEEQEVEVAFAKLDENASLELLCPLNESGPIHKFIQKRGEGIHHICLRVEDIEEKSQELRGKGYHLLYEEARLGAHGCKVNFIHPKSSGGVLIEISQKE